MYRVARRDNKRLPDRKARRLVDFIDPDDVVYWNSVPFGDRPQRVAGIYYFNLHCSPPPPIADPLHTRTFHYFQAYSTRVRYLQVRPEKNKLARESGEHVAIQKKSPSGTCGAPKELFSFTRGCSPHP
jgi:hypothetical protein